MAQSVATLDELLVHARETLSRGETWSAQITVRAPCPNCGVNPTVVLMTMTPLPKPR